MCNNNSVTDQNEHISCWLAKNPIIFVSVCVSDKRCFYFGDNTQAGKKMVSPPPSAFCAAILWLLMPSICIHITLLPPPSFSSIISNQSVIDQNTSYNLALISWCDSESLLTSVFIRSKISHLLLATCLTHKTWSKTTEINRTFRFAY